MGDFTGKGGVHTKKIEYGTVLLPKNEIFSTLLIYGMDDSDVSDGGGK